MEDTKQYNSCGELVSNDTEFVQKVASYKLSSMIGERCRDMALLLSATGMDDEELKQIVQAFCKAQLLPNIAVLG
jgi:hypothetical protein